MIGLGKSAGLVALALALSGAVALWVTQGPAIVTQLWTALCL
ncbi:MAG: hypothetical protein ACKOEE_03100 [Tagaea sp.]|jgi:hypothetical protein|nr:hypothetical protein [Magnetospirillum sp.]